MYKTFVTIPKAVPEKLCDEMVKESSEYTEHLAGVMWKKEADLKKDRNSKVRWYPLDHWIVPKLCEIASDVNKQDYLFNVTNLQCPQFTEYTKGQHYQWHRDIYPPESDGPYPGLIRKLSMIVNLSDAFKSRNVEKVDLLIGSNNDEWSLYFDGNVDISLWLDEETTPEKKIKLLHLLDDIKDPVRKLSLIHI